MSFSLQNRWKWQKLDRFPPLSSESAQKIWWEDWRSRRSLCDAQSEKVLSVGLVGLVAGSLDGPPQFETHVHSTRSSYYRRNFTIPTLPIDYRTVPVPIPQCRMLACTNSSVQDVGKSYVVDDSLTLLGPSWWWWQASLDISNYAKMTLIRGLHFIGFYPYLFLDRPLTSSFSNAESPLHRRCQSKNEEKRRLLFGPWIASNLETIRILNMLHVTVL